MKSSKTDIHRKTYRIPQIRFEDQRLTSFAGLVVFQSLFNQLALKQQLTACFRHLKVSPIFGHGLTVLLLIVHLLLGYRRLQDSRCYQDDPMVHRLLGLKRLPDVDAVKRVLLWQFEQLGTLRRKLIQRAGWLTKPQGKLTLTMSANPTVKSELLQYLQYLEILKQAA